MSRIDIYCTVSIDDESVCFLCRLPDGFSKNTGHLLNIRLCCNCKCVTLRTGVRYIPTVEFVLAPQHETSFDPETTRKEDFD